MDMGSSTAMAMASTTMAMDSSMTTTMTSAAAAATASMAMSMGDSTCKISMLWNWYTIDACFLAKSWHITSHGMFAGSCIGVILLVMSLEFLRRVGREFDRYIATQAQRKLQDPRPTSDSHSESGSAKEPALAAVASRSRSNARKFRPDVFQQLVRALIHMVQFGVAYIIMLLAMYYNGYIIICIIIGAGLGAFVFSWEPIDLGLNAKEEVTLCCG